ncbi:MAG: hypothetical protein BWK80_41445 [Desulfobacteraceae bacterium IS3]|nr:MAG: hypothetical protein BWK80_41445 [Desulfobacteraceae bacterium IS3]
MNKKIIWITWERQRRSLELAKALNARCYVLSEPDALQGIARYLYLIIKTAIVLVREKPGILFVQNPSIVLAAFACAFKKYFDYKLIVDRHSNFKLETLHSNSIKWKSFHFLSRYTIKNADMTIITNDYLSDIVGKLGGKGFILQDKLPEMALGEPFESDGKKHIVFISAFAEDEPLAEVIEAATFSDRNRIFHITGDCSKYGKKHLLRRLPPNIKLTGFLAEKDYQSLLMSADLLIVMTKKDHLINCGIYEAVAIGKPVIVSDTEAIKNYFKRGVIFSKYDSRSIAAAIRKGMTDNETVRENIRRLKEELFRDWEKRFGILLQIINEL